MWLVVGGLAVMLWSRSRFKKQDGVFATKMRLESGSAPGVGGKWPPMSSFALWVHDVLLVHKGLGLMNASPLGVAISASFSYPAQEIASSLSLLAMTHRLPSANTGVFDKQALLT